MIKRAPLKTDSPGTCSRWHVVIYNQETGKKDWHTVLGPRSKAKELQADLERAKRDDEYMSPNAGPTFEEVSKEFLDDLHANNRRVSTLQEYETELKLRVLPQIDEKLLPLGPRKIRKIKFADVKRHFNALRNNGSTVSQVNKAIKTVKAICTFAKAMKYVTNNIMEKYPKLAQPEEEGERTERTVNRGIFSESELQAIFAAATLFERALMGVLGFTGPRPGEAYALEWTEVYLDVERPYFRIVRSWCSKGFKFYKPKTEAGLRTVPIPPWLAAVLREYRERCRVGSESPKGLVFPAELASLDQPASERVTSPVCEQALALYEAGVHRQEIAQRLGSTAKKISQMIWYERTARERAMLPKNPAPPGFGGHPLNKSNVRTRIWIPLLQRAGVPYRDLYSFRWTYVSFARASGEAAFNVSRVIGHARSKIVDDIYAHTVDSGIAGVSESVAKRAGFTLPSGPPPLSPPPESPTPPPVPRAPPKLRVIQGGQGAGRENQADGRKPVESAPVRSTTDSASI